MRREVLHQEHVVAVMENAAAKSHTEYRHELAQARIVARKAEIEKERYKREARLEEERIAAEAELTVAHGRDNQEHQAAKRRQATIEILAVVKDLVSIIQDRKGDLSSAMTVADPSTVQSYLAPSRADSWQSRTDSDKDMLLMVQDMIAQSKTLGIGGTSSEQL